MHHGSNIKLIKEEHWEPMRPSNHAHVFLLWHDYLHHTSKWSCIQLGLQSVNQSTEVSSDKASINRSMNQSTNQPININQSSVNQASISQTSTEVAIRQPININQPINESVQFSSKLLKQTTQANDYLFCYLIYQTIIKHGLNIEWVRQQLVRSISHLTRREHVIPGNDHIKVWPTVPMICQ